MLQEAVHAKGRASAALQQAQQQLDESREHLTLLRKQLAEERQAGAASAANLDCVEAELAHCKTQVRACSSSLDEVCSRGPCTYLQLAELLQLCEGC